VFTVTRDRPLATTITGSLPRPSWFTASLRGRAFPVAMSDQAFREQYLDALAAFFSDQYRAGLDLFTDGDARCDADVAGRSWFSYAAERLGGLDGYAMGGTAMGSNLGKSNGDLMMEVIETRVLPRVVGPVTAGPLEYGRVWKIAQRMAPRPVKLGAISAQTLERGLHNLHYPDRRSLVLELADVMNREYHALADAGCPVIQVEEPAVHAVAGAAAAAELSADFYVEAFNREVKGLRERVELWCHTCWGNPAAQRTENAWRSYEPALPYLDRLDVDVLTFEAADSGAADLAAIGRLIGQGKKVCIGVVSHRTLQVERPEEVAALVRRALEHIAPERLLLSTDCGFGRQGMSRMHAFYKMVAIVRGANLVRRERGLPEAPIPAADDRYSLLSEPLGRPQRSDA
jgi:5-methyltetrahydropteroyltriglutamate--homocysteine methyltransferase